MFLLSDLQLVSSVAEADSAIGLFDAARPELTLVDLDLPFARSLDVIRRIRELDPIAWIIGLVTYEWDECARESLDAGASGEPTSEYSFLMRTRYRCEDWAFRDLPSRRVALLHDCRRTRRIAVEVSGHYSWLVDEMERLGHWPKLCSP